MDFSFFSDAFFTLKEDCDVLTDIGERELWVGRQLADSPRLATNPAYVAVAFTYARNVTMTSQEVIAALAQAMARVELLPMDWYNLRAYIAEKFLDEGMVNPGDFRMLKEVVEAIQSAQPIPPDVSRLLEAQGWFPATQFVVTSFEFSRSQEYMNADPVDVEEVGQVVDRLIPSLRLGVYASASQAEKDALQASLATCSALVRRLGANILAGPDLQEIVGASPVAEEDIQLCAQMVAVLVANNADFESAVSACGLDLAWRAGTELPDYDTRVEYQDPDVQTRLKNIGVRQSFESYMNVYKMMFDAVQSVEALIFLVRSKVDEVAGWALAPAVMIMDMLGVLAKEFSKGVTMLAGFIVDTMATHFGYHDQMRAIVGTVLFGLADLVDIRHRSNPKSVWAMLTSRKGAKISKDELMLLQMATFKHAPSDSYESWAASMIERLERHGAPVDVLSPLPPTRAVYYPRNTYGPADNNDLATAVDVNFHETAREVRRVQEALAAGAPRGVDGAWLADATALQASIDRYIVPRPTLSSEAKMKIREAADALFDHTPELYDRPRPASVRSVMEAMEWKYSAGLPFMPVIRTRQQLKHASWWRAIAGAAQEIIDSGQFPDIAFHGFPKADVVPRDKVLADLSAVRSVTAADRITAVAANTLLLEVNKRVAPLEAWVANQLPRREGGMQEALAALNARDCFVSTDGWRFDSQVPEEVMTIGSLRLYERGVEGMWGARAASTLVESYYAALARGIVVNLADGGVRRKTGGGGTGSAFTASDNRDWVRIVLTASWSLVTDRPCSEFWDHVTLVNASDDIILSVADWMRDLLPDWEGAMFDTFGLRFTFDIQGDADGFLHLQTAKLDGLDRVLYNNLGVDVPDFPVRHDPNRLLVKRSDYRSDRMRHSALMAADFIATQDFGHLLLTAHSPDLYSSVMHEAIDATSEYLGYFFKDVEFNIQKNRRGQIMACSYSVSAEPSAHLIRDMHRRFENPSSPEANAWKQTRLATARRWIKCHQYPSYLEVFKSWVVPEDWARLRPSQKKWAKMISHMSVSVPAIDLIQAGMLRFADVTAMIPTGLTRWSGLDVAPVTRPLVTQAFMVEQFVYAKYVQNHGVPPSFSEFAAKCREAPYGSVTDPNGFWVCRASFGLDMKIADPDSRDREMAFLSGRMFVFTVFYGIIDHMQVVLRMNRWLGFLMSLFFLLVRDLDKWYSLLHLAYWLDKGEASIAISNMSPRDPFIAQKMFAMLLTALIPFTLLRAMSFIPIMFHYLRIGAEFLYSGFRLRTAVASSVNRALQNPGDRWDQLRFQLEQGTHEADRITKIIAPMGSGKSTSLPSTLLLNGRWSTVIIVVPTVALVENYVNPFVIEDEILRVSAPEDLRLLPKQVVVITAHRYLSLELADAVFTNAITLFDETHLATTAQMIAWDRTRNRRRVMMSGTPRGRLWDLAPGREYDFQIPLNNFRTVVPFRGEEEVIPTQIQTVAGWISELLTAYGHLPVFNLREVARFAVFHPSVAGVGHIATLMRRSGFNVSTTTRNEPAIANSGVVVGTWTIVTGVNFVPPIDAIIDCGVEAWVEPAWRDLDGTQGGANLRFRNGATRIRLGPSSPSTAAQVQARTGRTQPGIAFVSPISGTGVERDPYPDVQLLLEYGLEPGLRNPDHEFFAQHGIETELVVHPTAQLHHNAQFPLLQWIVADVNNPLVARHIAFLLVTYCLAIVKGSVMDAVLSIQSLDNSPAEDRALVRRVIAMFPTAHADIDLRFPPQNLLRMMSFVGLAHRAGGVTMRTFGCLPVVYTFHLDDAGHNIVRTRRPVARVVRRLSISGSYNSYDDPVRID